MTALVMENLPLVSGAPGGIAKLRELILVLAVRGKLVPPDSSDEPASELLKRTAEARSQRPRRGKSPARSLVQAISHECPYPAPLGWQWCRLADLVDVLNGRAYKKEELLDAGTPVLRVGNLFTSKHWYYSDLELDGDRYCSPGDLLYAWSASFGPFIWAGDRAIYHYHIWKLKPHSEADLSRRYLHTYLAEQTHAIKAAGHGVSMTHMTKEKMERITVPLPPLSEQYRIVAKVDELMALCDRLEAEQGDAEAAHAKLVEELLASITQARDAADFRASWQQLVEHSHTLFTTEASVDALEEVILELSVSGRLTKQNPTDGTSDSLIAEIDEHRTGLVAEQGLRTSARPDVPLAEQFLQVPANWRYCRLGNLARFIDYRGKTPVKTSSGVMLITAKNVRFGYISREPREFIASEGYVSWMTRGIPRPGDLLFTTEAPLGNIAIIDIAERFALAQRVICFQLHRVQTGPFLRIALMSKSVQTAILEMATGMTATGVKASKLKELPIPLPPLAEQQRIVATVDQLMELCARIKREVANAQEQHEHLARELVEQAVA